MIWAFVAFIVGMLVVTYLIYVGGREMYQDVEKDVTANKN